MLEAVYERSFSDIYSRHWLAEEGATKHHASKGWGSSIPHTLDRSGISRRHQTGEKPQPTRIGFSCFSSVLFRRW